MSKMMSHSNMILVNKKIPARLYESVVNINKMNLGTTIIVIDDSKNVMVDGEGIMHIPHDDHLAITKVVNFTKDFVSSLADGEFDMGYVCEKLGEIVNGK